MRRWAAILFMLPLMASCHFESQSVACDTPLEGWQRAAEISLRSRDTVSRRDISLFVRYESSMIESDTLQLHIVTSTPSGATIAERIDVELRGDAQQFKSGATLKKRPYREDVVWQESGTYSIKIYPTKPTKGVSAVGVIVSKQQTDL